MSSFLTAVAKTSRTAAVAAPSARIAAVHTSRTFTTSATFYRTPTETVKDGLKSVDRAVSDKLVDGINIATTVKDKVVETADQVSHSETAAKAQEMKGTAAGKAEELKGKAKGTAEHAKGKVKGSAEEIRRSL